jgi:hypothetical protein
MVMRFLGSEGASVLKQCSPSLPLSMSSIVKSPAVWPSCPIPSNTSSKTGPIAHGAAQLFGIKDAGFLPVPLGPEM